MPSYQDYLRDSVSNGNRIEQALIRRWWYEKYNASGEMVWEYHIEGFYIDAIWFQNTSQHGIEHPGQNTASHFPLRNRRIVICEAKSKLTPELIGQALVYSQLAKQAGAIVESTMIFFQKGEPTLASIANNLGLEVVFENQRR